MLWVLLGALGVYIAEELGSGRREKALVVAIPILSGSLLRVPLGLLSDRFGGKRVGTIMLVCLYGPLTLGWLAGDSLNDLLAIGALLGVAGASFAVALPLASRWYPPEKQGLAMGIAAAGNSGTVVTNLIAPRLAASIGWHGVMAVAMIPLTIALVVFVLLAKESPRRGGRRRRWRSTCASLRERDLWSFCLLYSVTFGGYVGLGSFLPLMLRDQYQVTPVTAGLLTALVAVRRQHVAAGRRHPRRQGRRRAAALDAPRRHRRRLRRLRDAAGAAGRRRGAGRADAVPRPRQRRGVPDGAAALRPRDRPRHRRRRRDRRHRRLHPPERARPGARRHRIVLDRLRDPHRARRRRGGAAARR